ncbi:unnamed protein product, partial [Ixodes pacificus]
MNVRSAVQLFSVPVTAVGPTVAFMKRVHKCFTIMNVSNCQQHIHLNNADARHFTDVDDARLDWLETVFLEYIKDLKSESRPENFLSKETYHALVFTTKSNVECVRYLLTAKQFKYVLTRKLSSEPIESMFGFLRRSAGCNDALDVKSALYGLEKMLKTGIIAASRESNVQTSMSFFSNQLVAVQQRSPADMRTTDKCMQIAEEKLREQCLSTRPCHGNPDVASVAVLGGYIVRAANEHIPCEDCTAPLQGSKAYTPLQGLIAHQDRGGLCYPSQELVKLLIGLRKFAETALFYRKSIPTPLKVCMQRSVSILMYLPILTCENKNRGHRQQ